MKTMLLALLAVTAAASAGCVNLAYGWKQEREMLRHLGASVAAGVRNENDLLPPPWDYALKKEFHQAQPLAGFAHGVRADWHRVTTR